MSVPFARLFNRFANGVRASLAWITHADGVIGT